MVEWRWNRRRLRRRSCKGIRLRIRNDKILTKRGVISLSVPSYRLSYSRASNWHSHKTRGRNVGGRGRILVRCGEEVGQLETSRWPKNSTLENKPPLEDAFRFRGHARHTTRGRPRVKMYFWRPFDKLLTFPFLSSSSSSSASFPPPRNDGFSRVLRAASVPRYFCGSCYVSVLCLWKGYRKVTGSVAEITRRRTETFWGYANWNEARVHFALELPATRFVEVFGSHFLRVYAIF